MNVKTLIIFFAGVASGALGMRFYLKDKMDKELDAAVEMINSEYKRDREILFKEATEEKSPEEKEEIAKELKHFRSETAKLAYDSFFKEADDEPPVEKIDEPCLISANEFATSSGLDKITLTYYINADILAEDGDILENNYEELLGNDWREHFNDEEEGVVYVRNEKMGAEYEVLLDEMDAESVKEYFGYDS